MLSYPLWCDGVPGLRFQSHPLVIPGEEPEPLGPVLGHVGQRGDGREISIFWGWTFNIIELIIFNHFNFVLTLICCKEVNHMNFYQLYHFLQLEMG